jgi:hypothetical protein
LYEAAVRFRDAHPWEWMTETDLFGIQNPETEEIYYASIMGMRGEHRALALYQGSQGLYRFWHFQETAETAPPEALFEIPHLQASFEDRNMLNQKDREIIKSLGLKFRGRGAWPMFRSYQPGYVPWFVTAQEARCLTWGLEQSLEVAQRFERDPALLQPPDQESYLVRVPRQERKALTWEERWLRPPPPAAQPIEIKMDLRALAHLHRLPRGKMNLQVDLFMFPARIREKDARPYFPYSLLLVDAQSGFVLGTELLAPEPSLEAMWGTVPLKLVQTLVRTRALPARITVRSDLLKALLEPLTDELGIQLRQSHSLRALDSAKEFLVSRFI